MYRQTAWLLCWGMLAAGCSAGGSSVGDSPEEMKRRDVASLPAVDDYLPPIDDGRLLVAPPAEWSVLPRGRSFLQGFAKGKPNELPRILISADIPPPESPDELTEENAAAFAERLATEVEADVKSGRKLVPEYHLPIVLGQTVFIRHVRHASLGGNLCAVQSLQTVRGGRLYNVELIVQIDPRQADDYGAELKRYRDYGYTVAAHLKFTGDDEQQNPSAPAQAVAEQAAEGQSDTK